MLPKHTCKYDVVKGTNVGQEPCEACAMYDSIMKDAHNARSCHNPHHCPRFEHLRSQWSDNPPPRFTVEGSHNDGERYYSDTLFSGTKEECETYIDSFKGLSQEDQEAYNLPRSPTLKLVDAQECKVCDMHDKRKGLVAQGHMPPFLIVAYGISRHYGGPEEGGWWYDNTDILSVRKAHTWQEGLRHARELRAEYPQPRFNRHSCANRGEPDTFIRLVYAENDPRMPQENHTRPHYE